VSYATPPVVVVTRDEHANDEFSRMLSALGAEPRGMQTIAIAPPKDLTPLDAALADFAKLDWIVFTSPHAVDAVCAHPNWRRTWKRTPGFVRIAAVGRATAARLTTQGIDVDLVPETASSSALVEALMARAGSLKGTRILWPRSDIARRDLPDALTAAGARVVDPPAYRTVAVRPRGLSGFVQALADGSVDAVAFLSPSSALGLAAVLAEGTLRPLAGRTAVASIGPTTTATLAKLGAPPDVEPQDRTARALAEAIVEHLGARKGARV
jgi:uroporphyrinogen-III synthase